MHQCARQGLRLDPEADRERLIVGSERSEARRLEVRSGRARESDGLVEATGTDGSDRGRGGGDGIGS